MYLKKLKIWNFRCFGSKENNNPGIEIEFDPDFNLIIGSNDSGKTAIIDAIWYCLGTQTNDPIRIEIEDFYQKPDTKERAQELKIECFFSGFTNIEAGQFLEWIDCKKDENGNAFFELKVWLKASIKNNRITYSLRAGIDDEGQYIEGEARDLLRVTYLKPLRDAESELTPGYRSRLYQILKSHPVFEKKAVNEKHPVEKYFNKASEMVLEFFEKEKLDKNDELGIDGTEPGGKKIKDNFIIHTQNFLEKADNRIPEIKISPIELNAILRKLQLLLEENKSGLGTLNMLYTAAELIHLKRESYNGLRLALIEELEAHLHPQAQLRVLKSLLSESEKEIQFIFTTHSTLLGSSFPLKKIKLCINGEIYSLDPNSTNLNESDYQFLERFLDATKANLFFSKGVIIVEGDAENIIIPGLSELIDRPLHKYGVSIVNVGSKALLRYVNIFKKKDNSAIPINISVVTDLDFETDDDSNIDNDAITTKRKEIEEKYNSINNAIKTFVSPLKTLEFDIAMGNLYVHMHKAIEIAKKIKNKKDWITSDEIQQLQLKDFANQTDPIRIAKQIYEPIEKNAASKSVTAQWFVKLLVDDKEKVLDLIKKDYKENKGIKYLIEAIEHVTENITWDDDSNNRY